MAYVKQHRPVAVEFCGKLSGDQERRFRVLFEGGGRYDAPAPKSELGRGLTRGLFLRPACYHCPYAGTDRTGDLTLANFAGGDLPVEEKRKGVSLLLPRYSMSCPCTGRRGRWRRRRPATRLCASRPR